MPRPRGFATDDVVRAARELFWERGYEATSLADIEERTGLNRSSLYQAFGSKRGLFDEAVRCYLREVAEPRLARLERPGAGLDEAVAYLRMLGDVLRSEPVLAARGCLVVNTVAELAGRDQASRDTGVAYRDRITDALAHALRGAAARGEIVATPAQAQARARVLAATVMGILLTARLDPRDAADLARFAAGEAAAWRV